MDAPRISTIPEPEGRVRLWAWDDDCSSPVDYPRGSVLVEVVYLPVGDDRGPPGIRLSRVVQLVADPVESGNV